MNECIYIYIYIYIYIKRYDDISLMTAVLTFLKFQELDI